jgi:hypothetical protein
MQGIVIGLSVSVLVFFVFFVVRYFYFTHQIHRARLQSNFRTFGVNDPTTYRR